MHRGVARLFIWPTSKSSCCVFIVLRYCLFLSLSTDHAIDDVR